MVCVSPLKKTRIFSALSRAIDEEQWTRVADLARQYPWQARVWSWKAGFFDGTLSAHVLPLHQALVWNAPYNAIEALVHAHPAALQFSETSYQRLPLHCACRKHASLQVIRLLVQHYPQACTTPDALQRLPLHYAITNGHDDSLLHYLLKVCPQSVAQGRDLHGYSPLHAACAAGASPDVIQLLLQFHPEAASVRTHSGILARQCIPVSCPHGPILQQLLLLVQQEQQQEIFPKAQEDTPAASPPVMPTSHYDVHHRLRGRRHVEYDNTTVSSRPQQQEQLQSTASTFIYV